MASYIATISDDDYNDKVKPAMVLVLNYEENKLEGETETQFIKRMIDEKLNAWIRTLRLEKQKRDAIVISNEDIFT